MFCYSSNQLYYYTAKKKECNNEIKIGKKKLINKLDDLQQYLEELARKFSVTGISGTWLNNDNESQIQLPGCSFVDNNRNTKTGGGVGMFISSVISFHVKNDLNLQGDGVLESFFY